MPEIELSAHAREMLQERNILEAWVWRTIEHSDRKYRGDDYSVHYTKAIKEYEGRVLHIVVNQDVYPNRIVTLFFDRRLGRKTGRVK